MYINERILKNKKKINSWIWKRPVGSHVTCGMWRNKPYFSIFLDQVVKSILLSINITLLVQVNGTDRKGMVQCFPRYILGIEVDLTGELVSCGDVVKISTIT